MQNDSPDCVLALVLVEVLRDAGRARDLSYEPDREIIAWRIIEAIKLDGWKTVPPSHVQQAWNGHKRALRKRSRQPD